jgi:hypothetical protein
LLAPCPRRPRRSPPKTARSRAGSCRARAGSRRRVVCAQDQEQFRARSSSDENPEGDQALNDGRLTPPDVAGRGIFKGKPTIAGKCLIPPCPPPTAYMIDLSTIPQAPVGSDADKIAKGEIRAP